MLNPAYVRCYSLASAEKQLRHFNNFFFFFKGDSDVVTTELHGA